jgi:cyclophilin family peptidyl-prolyl cis-trans isomerase
MSRCCSAVVLLFCVLFVSVSQAGVLVQFRTFFGDIEVELFEKDKPITVANFIRYVDSGRFRDGIAHRCISNFVIQGGAFWVTNRGTTMQDILPISSFGTIPNEYGKGMVYSNRYGTIAMAKQGGLTNSASSSWYFNLADNFSLDARNDDGYFTVFGRVVRGTNILELFRRFRHSPQPAPGETNVIADLTQYFPEYGFALQTCPLLTGALSFTDLIYFDITFLNVQITKVGSAREISWNSVAGLTNRVQYTTNFPPVWNQLIQTNGNGLTMRVQDDSAGARFYRVVVDY